jgi:esterase/lipase
MSNKVIKISVGTQLVFCKEFSPEDKTKNASIVMVHGWSSGDKKYVPLAKRLSELGFYALTVNLRGHRNSPYKLEEFSRQQHEEDIVNALRYVRERKPNNKIILLGKSYSGYLAAIVAEREGVNFLILSQPALYPDDRYDIPTKILIDNDSNVFKKSNQEPKFNRAIKHFAKFKGKILFIESENDEEVPKSTTANYLRYANHETTSVILAGADHSLSRKKWREVYYRTVINWLLEVIK